MQFHCGLAESKYDWLQVPWPIGKKQWWLTAVKSHLVMFLQSLDSLYENWLTWMLIGHKFCTAAIWAHNTALYKLRLIHKWQFVLLWLYFLSDVFSHGMHSVFIQKHIERNSRSNWLHFNTNHLTKIVLMYFNHMVMIYRSKSNTFIAMFYSVQPSIAPVVEDNSTKCYFWCESFWTLV